MARGSRPFAADPPFWRPRFAWFFGLVLGWQNNAKMVFKGTSKIIKNPKKSKKEGAEKHLKFVTSKNTKNNSFWESLEPAGSC